MSVVLDKGTSEWVLNGEYEINRICLNVPEACHTHRFIEIVYTYHGRGRHVIDDREYFVGHGDLLLIDYHSRHTVYPIEDLRYVDIMLKPEFLSEDLRGSEDAYALLKLEGFAELDRDAMTGNLPLRFDGEDRKKLETLIEWTEQEQRQGAAGATLVRHAALNLLLSMIFRKMAEAPRADLCIDDELLAYMERNCAERLRIDELAAKCFYTPAYFCRAFKRYTGRTPKDYIAVCRIKRAQQLLRQTDMPVEEIISECGFSNRTAFFQRFASVVGCSPLQYRRGQK